MGNRLNSYLLANISLIMPHQGTGDSETGAVPIKTCQSVYGPDLLVVSIPWPETRKHAYNAENSISFCLDRRMHVSAQ